MKYVIRGLSFLLIPIIVSGILAFLRHPQKAEKGKVYLPKFFVIWGSILSTVFLIPTFITAFSDEPIWIPILFFAFSLLGATSIIAFINCRISYDEDGFVAKNFFGIKRSFTYAQVTAFKENRHENYIYIGKRKVMIDEFSIGGIEFIALVHQKYKKLHRGQKLPEIRKTKHDIFNGNVYDVAGCMFAYIAISLTILALGGFIVWYIFFTPSTVDNTIEQQVIFKSYDKNGENIILTSTDDQIYKIRFADEQINTESIKELCNKTTVVTVYSKEIAPDKKDDYYSIKAIRYHDTYLLSFDETNKLHRQEYLPLIWVVVILGVAWGAFVTGSIIVGRNPKKFSKKIVKLFFKEGYVKY